MTSLSGKVAIITGSTAGIGLAIAQKLGERGATVVISSRKQDSVDETLTALRKGGINAAGIVCHVAKSQDRDNLIKFTVERFGKIDILVNNAAINPHFGSLLDVTEAVWDRIFDANVKAAFLLSKAVVPYMEKQGGGSIIFVSSVGAYIPGPGIMAYSISKTALLGLTKALAETLASRKIRVNCIAPGTIKTNFSRTLWDGENVWSQEFIKNRIPMQRIGMPEECSGIVAFLCSEEASYITGETVNVSGGIPAKL